MLNLTTIKPKYILIAILLLAAFLRLYRLDFPNKYVFDEVYHAFTAKEFLANHKEGWEWWNTPPPGVAYEWTHPPLAKEIMAVSMFALRTQDAWSYRLPGVLFGVLSVYLVYLLGLKLLNSQKAALIAAFVFSLDGLNFVQSRTGMNDIYYVTFVLACLLLLLNKQFIFAAIVFGLALSSKWASIYAYLIFIPLLLKNRQYLHLASFAVIPPIIYFLSYSPFFFIGHNLNQFKELQQQMWWYHTNLKATHSYSSPWWSWPLNLYPVWYFVDYGKNTIANIFASGNPALFWSGVIAVILTIREVILKKSLNLLIILLGFFSFWLPWSISPRIMFLYHFSPSVPFLSLALGYQLNKLLESSERKKLAITILVLIILAFVLIFPFLTAVPIPRDFVKVFFMTNLSKNIF
ncbi:phospholipid carrier-dependent glycosyltransferase [Candidatus Daviesbacteria bacterium]|nr:phospholipid carrier-dependent glycosyltransferase [Candidatus Daviesbacteria bacterium]